MARHFHRGDTRCRLGRQAKLHDLTEAVQGKYHYTIGPYSDPVLHVEPGDRIRIDTRDAFEGAIRTEHDKPTKRLRMPFVNPQNGPIMVDGRRTWRHARGAYRMHAAAR